MMCLNKKFLIGAGVVAVGVLLVKPAWALAILPLLLLALCPLSMMFMMRGMNGRGGTSGVEQAPGTTSKPDLDKQIADLQEEVRILRAASAQRRTTAETPPPTVDLGKPDQSGPRS